MIVVTTVAVLWITSRPRCSDALTHRRSQCVDASAAERWGEASIACAREADETGESALGLRGARALLNLDHTDEALRSAQRWFGSNDDATALQITGAAYDKRGEPAQALPWLRRALAVHMERGEHEEAALDEGYLAGALLHIGLLGDAFDAAEAAVQEAGLTNPENARTRLQGKMRLKLGKILVELGDFATAQTTLWDAQQTLADWPADQAWVFLQLGMLREAIDDYAGAAFLFERALELASKADVALVPSAAHLNLARMKRELGEFDAAEFQMRQLDESMRARSAALLVEGLIAADRGHREVAEQLLAQAASRAPTDDYAMDIALQRGLIAERALDTTAAEQYYRTAIMLVEKLRGGTNSLELRPWVLARRRIPYRLLLSLLARQNRRVEALVVAEQLHARSWLDALVGRTGANGVRARFSSAVSLGRRLQANAAKPLASDELLTLLHDREALVFSETESDIWRFHIIDGAIAQLDRLPDQTRSLLESWRKNPYDRVLETDLGTLLIPPAARTPSQRPLYIVTNGALDTLPFAALRAEGHFLIENRVISRLPGVVALRCRARHGTLRSSVFLGDSRDNLNAAREETRALASMLDGAAFVGPDATVERLAASRDTALLHLAIHADVDHTGARLLLASQQEVTVADIVEHEIGPRVAVLAGCATAVARDAEGWGALSSAFLVAGSRSVVGTLQSVKDSDALEIMRRFYALDGARQPAIALAKAQRPIATSTAAK